MRLIDADALFKEFERAAWYDNADRDEIAEEILLQMPTIDAVPVVMCEDCFEGKRMELTNAEFARLIGSEVCKAEDLENLN